MSRATREAVIGLVSRDLREITPKKPRHRAATNFADGGALRWDRINTDGPRHRSEEPR